MSLDTTDRSRIDQIPISWLLYHEGQTCCLESRQLIVAKFQQYPDVGSQLAAIPATFRWGPTRWPAYWCDLLEPKELVADCGVHANLASELLWAAGIEHKRGRAAIAAGRTSVAHWNATWNEADASDAWLGEDVVHHEVVKVGDRWWDATEARWFSGPGAALVAGIVVAVREADGEWELLSRS
ncbi:MAG TPA: hypothetical protein VNA20_05300 [Frankiaceae bacterium]|nr:hypothetical protein [Frankiaceae bacterium]